MIRNFRKPLIVAAPKILLRHSDCVSSLADMADGKYFLPVHPDNPSKVVRLFLFFDVDDDAIFFSPLQLQIDAKGVKRLLFTSGKHYYTLSEEREKRQRADVAIIRIEELCPFPAEEIRQEMKKYPNAKEFLWCQEEHRNQGPWSFINPRFANIIGHHVSRTNGRKIDLSRFF